MVMQINNKKSLQANQFDRINFKTVDFPLKLYRTLIFDIILN